MKSISAKELGSNLEAILNPAQSERVLIWRRGKPCAVLVGVEDFDAEDLQLASSESFRRMIRERRTSGKSYLLAEVKARLQASDPKPARKRTTNGKSRKRS